MRRDQVWQQSSFPSRSLEELPQSEAQTHRRAPRAWPPPCGLLLSHSAGLWRKGRGRPQDRNHRLSLVLVMHTHVHTCAHTCIHTCAHTYTCTHSCAHTYTHACLHMHAHTYTYTHTHHRASVLNVCLSWVLLYPPGRRGSFLAVALSLSLSPAA